MTVQSQYLFPVPITYVDSTNFATIDLKHICYDIAREHEQDTFECPCYTTISTRNQVLSMQGFEAAKQAAIDAVIAQANFWKVSTANLQIIDSWINLYEEHGYQDLHMHHGSVISGCMYVESVGNNDLWFQAPWHTHQPVVPKYFISDLTNCHNVWFPSFEGRCYAWPSHLMHKTTPATQRRISISYNATYV